MSCLNDFPHSGDFLGLSPSPHLGILKAGLPQKPWSTSQRKCTVPQSRTVGDNLEDRRA